MSSEPARRRRRATGRSRGWVPCVLGIAALVVTGCGGASGDSASIVPSGPRAQLIAQADAICERRDNAIDGVDLSGSSAASIERFAAQSASLERSALTELSKLATPASMTHEWRQILAYTSTLLQYIVELGENAKHHDTRSILALSQSDAAVKHQLQIAATHAGFRFCSRLR
jgi:hypothetical protein